MLPQPHLIFSTAYHAHAPATPSQYSSNATTACLPSPMLTVPWDPQDMPLTLPSNFCPQPSLGFNTPATYQAYTPAATPCLPSPILMLLHPTAYHAYIPAAPSRYAFEAATSCVPSPILSLKHTHRLPCLLCCHPISTLTHTHTSAPLPLTMLMLLQDPQDIPLMLPPNVFRHPSLGFCPSSPYNPYASVLDP
ncbi:hypothetical protein O181_020729 [Austropuccinia psidii MF-1]|uniref:Uncharacterized protein n=1 Tax=Austropuccinia psidii MF-1 TaxID=1389203 RepID=A0A9Q3GVZ7_9BASI|nr:hypothetical protein [Austropuccinia psidii MF-1]